jgi:expansin (peptidoglycan-binding protein)
MYGPLDAVSPFCGKRVRIKRKDNGKTVDVTIRDACEGCETESLDLSLGAFKEIGTLDEGVIDISWELLT